MKKFLTKTEQQEAKQAMRKKIIAMLLDWKPGQFGTFDPATMRRKPNMAMIYEWVNTYGHKKPTWLNKYTYGELVTLVSQINQITKKK